VADLNARIKPKKSSTAGEVPLAADLEVSELAVNTADGKLFVKHTDDTIKEIGGGGGGGGAVDSVNGQTGAVSLGIQDMDDYAPYYDTPAPTLEWTKGADASCGNDETVQSTETTTFLNSVAVGGDINDFPSTVGATIWVQVGTDPVEEITISYMEANDFSCRRRFRPVPAGLFAAADGTSFKYWNANPVVSEVPLADGDILQWVDAEQEFKPAQLPGGGGAVDSVNGETGVVSLGIQDMDDYALKPSGSTKTWSFTTAATPNPANGVISNWTGSDWALNVVDADGNNLEVELYNMSGGESVTIYVNGASVHTGTVLYWSNKNSGRITCGFDDDSWKASLQDGDLIGLEMLAFPSTPIPLADGDILQWVDADQKFEPTQLPSGSTRTTASVTTSSLASTASEEVTLTGTGKAGQFLSVTTDRPAWIVFYANEVSRTSDSSRLETDSPSPGSGVLMEIITTTGETIIVSPSVSYFNNETSPVASLPLKVTNKDASTQAVQVDVSLIPSET
jgi:hypothetical protein